MITNEILEYLAFRVNSDYAKVRFVDCVFEGKQHLFTMNFIYDEGLNGKLDELKPRLESEFKEKINQPVEYVFDYKSSYMDADRLSLLVRKFLMNNFSIMTLGVVDDDIVIKKDDRLFVVEISLPMQAVEFVKKSKAYDDFVKSLFADYFYSFDFKIIAKHDDDGELDLESIEKMVGENIAEMEAKKVNKSMPIKNMEYYLGAPIKERPIKIEFLKTCPDFQVIAGTMGQLKTRESKAGKKFWTFVLDDGINKANCVFFPNENNAAKFDKLVDGTVVCLLGVHDERNGYVNFNVRGVSFCELT